MTAPKHPFGVASPPSQHAGRGHHLRPSRSPLEESSPGASAEPASSSELLPTWRHVRLKAPRFGLASEAAGTLRRSQLRPPRGTLGTPHLQPATLWPRGDPLTTSTFGAPSQPPEDPAGHHTRSPHLLGTPWSTVKGCPQPPPPRGPPRPQPSTAPRAALAHLRHGSTPAVPSHHRPFGVSAAETLRFQNRAPWETLRSSLRAPGASPHLRANSGGLRPLPRRPTSGSPKPTPGQKHTTTPRSFARSPLRLGSPESSPPSSEAPAWPGNGVKHHPEATSEAPLARPLGAASLAAAPPAPALT